MATLFRGLMWLATAALTLSVVAVILGYYVVSRSLPDYDRKVEVAALETPVEILRSNTNVPHIFAESDEAAYLALGYAHAQNRLWQMTMMRRTAQGKLAELFGADVAGIDELLRRLDIYGLAVQSVEAQSIDIKPA